jgi:hypothetical protein
MCKSGGVVQKLDAHVPAGLRGLLSGTLRRIKQVSETWKIKVCGITASRERVETTFEAVDEVGHDRR